MFSLRIAKIFFSVFISNMLKFRTNYSKTYIPMSALKGSTEQRLQLARLMNLRFFDNLQDGVINREISPGTFKKYLRQTVGFPIKIDMAESLDPKTGSMNHILLGNGVSQGYIIEVPYTSYTKKVHESSSLVFLKETQKFFEEILNPKFFQRVLTMLDKGYKIKDITDFYTNNITKTQKLTTKALEEFLQGKPATQQIDMLQFFRYQLLKEQNGCVGIKGIEDRIAKHQGVKYQHKGDFYSFKDRNFEEKFAIIENKLKEIIQAERAKK